MNSHQKWLLAAVPILLKAGLVNIANTCEQAAAEIERLQKWKDNTVSAPDMRINSAAEAVTTLGPNQTPSLEPK